MTTDNKNGSFYKWQPLSTRRNGTQDYHALYTGVPKHLQGSLWTWVDICLRGTTTRIDNGTLLMLERRLRLNLGAGKDAGDAYFVLKTRCFANSDFFLDVVDCLLSNYAPSASVTFSLESILHEAHSLWRVDSYFDEFAMLEQRVDDTTREMALEAIQTGDQASEHLQLAWISAFAKDNSPKEAYSEAVKSVEAAAWKLISPNDREATLGKMIGEFKNNPEKWSIAMPYKTQNPHNTVLNMMETLWQGQTNRHGTGKPVDPEQITAEAATILAVTLVQWFNRGVVDSVNKS